MRRRLSSKLVSPISTRLWGGGRGRERQARALGQAAPSRSLPSMTKFFALMSKPDATLAELQAWLAAEHSLKVSIGCVWKRLRDLGLTLKKSPCAPLNKIAPISSKPARRGVQVSPI